jgi:hypothetical protein
MSFMKVNISVLACLLTLLEFLLAWIPIKLVAAQYAGQSVLADAVLTVL